MNAVTLPTKQGQGFVTAKTIAKFYGLTEPTVYRWAKLGKIPALKFEGTTRFDFEAVRRAIEGEEAAQ